MNAVFKPIGRYKSLNILAVSEILERRGLCAWLAIKVFRSKYIYMAHCTNGLRLPFSEVEKAAYEKAIQHHRDVMALYNGLRVTMNQHKTGGNEQ